MALSEALTIIKIIIPVCGAILYIALMVIVIKGSRYFRKVAQERGKKAALSELAAVVVLFGLLSFEGFAIYKTITTDNLTWAVALIALAVPGLWLLEILQSQRKSKEAQHELRQQASTWRKENSKNKALLPQRIYTARVKRLNARKEK